MVLIEGMMKVYARDCMSKAVLNIERDAVAVFSSLLALNVYMSAADVVACGCCNLEFGDLALEKFLAQKTDTITDDDVTVLGTYDFNFGLQALNVYTSIMVPSSSSIQKFAGAKKELARQAFQVLLSKPEYITVADVLRLRQLNYVWGRQAFDALFIEKKQKSIRLSVGDVVLLNDADAKWGRKAQRLSIGRWVS
mmetsp:Transcript_18203/g.25214  ORF Transcript_18203/g.25214 Transcript_18203/m.25214 type:complete len:195 (+) Transcript_18203:147-731(+)|eukprot:CAMPEP_0196586342 /NCGR_PEP_ID=MMETSP1081-20130531/53928_1 /TAXON_ID=36882 /ORGANISM="Pyramimonas amylifera, Strain CCMP720" /LENGTH=194 /DNA_ID=CAMNT_0041908189 /DNA_START=145 /DNA_END=729 /DNA_ORIENTATION=+